MLHHKRIIVEVIHRHYDSHAVFLELPTGLLSQAFLDPENSHASLEPSIISARKVIASAAQQYLRAIPGYESITASYDQLSVSPRLALMPRAGQPTTGVALHSCQELMVRTGHHNHPAPQLFLVS